MTTFPGTEEEMFFLKYVIERNCDCKRSMMMNKEVCGAHKLYFATQEELNALVFARWRFTSEREERNDKPHE
jgi:hypothetical protein